MQKIIISKLKILNYFCNPRQLSAPSLHFFSVLTTKTYQNKSNFASTSRRHHTELTKILQYGIFGKIFFLNVFQTTFYQIVMFKFQFTKQKNLQEMSSSGGALFISDTNLTLKRGADPTRPRTVVGDHHGLLVGVLRSAHDAYYYTVCSTFFRS